MYLVTSKAFKSNCLQMFYKIGVLQNFAKFKGKHLCWSQRPTEIPSQVSFYDFYETLKNAL